MNKQIIKVIVLFLVCGIFYLLGRSHAETKIITQKMEVIKYVNKKKAEIYSQPNADRSALLKLMQNNQL